MIYWDLMGYSGIYIGRIFFLRFFLFFLEFVLFFSLGHFSLLFATFWSKTSTLLNLGAKICHLHCSSIV